MRRATRLTHVVLVTFLLTITLSACGGSSEKTPTSNASPTTSSATTASPTTAPTTAPTKPAAQASPTAAMPTAPVASGPVEVDALWFSSDGTTAQGGTSRVKVSVQEKDSTDLRVGFFESEVGGSGQQWQAAGWMAVITASLLLSKNPSKYEFSFDVAGRIDGPSAGALMTAAVMAGYLGNDIKSDVTMTGTINPDGTIGPVGGIPQKLEGAAAAGKKTVLVPGGQRYDYDMVAGQSVDLVQAGQKLGIAVKLVPDIYTAYQELTGEKLPEPVSVGQASYPPAAFDKFRAGTTSWYANYQRERTAFTALPADIQSYRQGTIDVADNYASRADQFLAEGQVAAAYENSFQAAAMARVAREAAELDNIYASQGLDPLIQRLNASASALTRFDAVRQRLEAETPRTASDTIAIMEGFSSLSVAQGLVFQAEATIDSLKNATDPVEQDILNGIYRANYFYVYADQYLQLAQDQVSIGTGFGSSPTPDPAVLKTISDTLRRGAEANINYFEELVIAPFAQQYGVSADVAKGYFMQSDSGYLTAVAAVQGADSLAGQVIKPDAKSWVYLGSALTAYSQSASLIAKYYSLGARVDDSGYITSFDRQSSLADMLDLADQRAKTWVNSIADEDPIESLYYYDNARIFRTGNANDQLSALNAYWQSAILSATLSAFTGGIK